MIGNTLRPYQRLAVEAAYAHLRDKSTNPCIVIPTGGGKTHVIAEICRDVAITWKGRVLLLAHRKELLEQSHEKILPELEGMDVGVYSASIGRKETKGSVIIGGIQSVYSRAPELGRFDLVIVDEAHRIPPDGEGMYRKFLDEAKVVNPDVRILGLTATPYRMTTGNICAPGNILEEVCYEIGVKELIVDGYLCSLSSKSGRSASVADTSGVHLRGGEFIPGELEEAVMSHPVVLSAVKETVAFAKDQKKVLIFSCGVDHGRMILDTLAGILPEGERRPELITGETPMEERERILDSFRTGDLKYLVNINVLTEGFDHPGIDLIAILRPTKSPGLYSQMVGRGLRKSPGKSDCLILDFGENILRHGPIDRVQRRKGRPEAGGGEAPMKDCPQCQEMVPISMTFCKACGFEFPEREKVTHGKTASQAAILSEWKSEWYDVERVEYAIHEKKNAPPGHPKTMRVNYVCGIILKFSEWICLAHPEGSFANDKSKSWWRERHVEKWDPPPTLTAAVLDAQGGALRAPARIKVRLDPSKKELPKIVGYDWLTDSADSGTDFEKAIKRLSPAGEPGGEEDIPF